ncbi:MAG: ATP-grasp domain-containing protein [Bdellovibrionota bacterium]
MEFVLILGGEFQLRERVLAGSIRASNGLPTVTVAKNRVGNHIKFFDDVITANVMDPKNVVAAVRDYVKSSGRKIAAVAPMNDFVVRSGLAVAEAFGLNYNSRDTVEMCRDKFLMKERLAKFDVPIPRYGKFRTIEELEVIAKKIGYPLVIKPIELAGSVGVLKVTDHAQLVGAFEKCMADIKKLGGVFMTAEDLFQAEEYIEAQSEVSVEVINGPDFHKVIAVTEKYLGNEPYFVEIGHSVPSRHTNNEKLRQIAESACESLGIKYGMAHVEARITPGGDIRVIEVGARTGGDAIMDLVERAYGINPYEMHVASYLGCLRRAPMNLKERGVAAVAFLKSKPGTIRRIKPMTQFEPAIVNVQITAKPGDISREPISWAAREGSVEFFWPRRNSTELLTDHLDTAKSLSEELFTVE